MQGDCGAADTQKNPRSLLKLQDHGTRSFTSSVQIQGAVPVHHDANHDKPTYPLTP
jgi:hypothetical protein